MERLRKKTKIIYSTATTKESRVADTHTQLHHKNQNPKILKPVTQTISVTHHTPFLLMGIANATSHPEAARSSTPVAEKLIFPMR
jgi:hypothetical protein